MSKQTDMFGEALGILTITFGGVNIELEPTCDDYRAYRKIVTEGTKEERLNNAEKFIVELIARHYPDQDKAKIEKYVAKYLIQIFTDCMTKLAGLDKREIEETKAHLKREALIEAKKLM